MTDWRKIKRSYITGNCSTKDLAEKFGISKSMVEKRCANEGWREQRISYRKKLDEKAQDKSAEKTANYEAEIASYRAQAAMNIWRVIASASQNMGEEDGQRIRQIVSSYKDMCEVTEISTDTAEQEQAHNALIEAIKGVCDED